MKANDIILLSEFFVSSIEVRNRVSDVKNEFEEIIANGFDIECQSCQCVACQSSGCNK